MILARLQPQNQSADKCTQIMSVACSLDLHAASPSAMNAPQMAGRQSVPTRTGRRADTMRARVQYISSCRKSTIPASNRCNKVALLACALWKLPAITLYIETENRSGCKQEPAFWQAASFRLSPSKADRASYFNLATAV